MRSSLVLGYSLAPYRASPPQPRFLLSRWDFFAEEIALDLPLPSNGFSQVGC